MAQRVADGTRTLRESAEEYGKGIVGGLLFSLPLLYTMEMWWTGFIASPGRLALYLILGFGLLLGYNRYAGMRPDADFLEVVIDSVEELGIGLLLSALILLLLGRLTPEMSAAEIMGKVIVESLTVAIGVSVGTAQLGQGEGENGMGGEAPDKPIHFGGQLAVALCGAVLIAANVAPTQEILVLAVENSSGALLILASLSFLVTLAIVAFGTKQAHRRLADLPNVQPGLFATPITYAIALLASAYLLWFFGRLEGMGLSVIVGQVVVLALPASLGASVGRFLLQQ